MSAEDLMKRQHLTKVEPATLTQVISVAIAWRNYPDRMHPLNSFLTYCHNAEFNSRMDLTLDQEIKRAWNQQVILSLIEDFYRVKRHGEWNKNNKQWLDIQSLAHEVMPQGNYIQWLYDTMLEQNLSGAEFYSEPLIDDGSSQNRLKSEFLKNLPVLGADHYLQACVETHGKSESELHELLRVDITRCGEDIKLHDTRLRSDQEIESREREIKKSERKIKKSISQRWFNPGYRYEDGTTALELLIDLEKIGRLWRQQNSFYRRKRKVNYVFLGLKKRRNSLLLLLQGLYKVCGQSQPITDTILHFLMIHVSNEQSIEGLHQNGRYLCSLLWRKDLLVILVNPIC